MTEATKKIAKRPLAAEALPKFDLTKVKKEDKDAGGTSRFAAPLKVNYNLNNAGQWTTMENGDRIWQLKLHSPNAIGLIVMYDDFYLPKGGKD